MDSSEDNLGLEDIDGNGVGGVDEVEDGILLGNCKIIVGTEDCRVIPLERRGSLYTIKMWVRQDPGGSPSPSFPGPA